MVMAINELLYYYFKLKNGSPYAIIVWPIPVNTTAMTAYRELTEAQKAFYLANPSASALEVWKCELSPPYVPTTPDLQEYIAQKVKELKDACYASVTVTTLEYAAAKDKINNITADSFFSLTEANKVVNSFRTQSKKALTVYNAYKPQIEAASTVDAVDIVYTQAINQIDG